MDNNLNKWVTNGHKSVKIKKEKTKSELPQGKVLPSYPIQAWTALLGFFVQGPAWAGGLEMAMWAEVEERSERAEANTTLAKREAFMLGGERKSMCYRV